MIDQTWTQTSGAQSAKTKRAHVRAAGLVFKCYFINVGKVVNIEIKWCQWEEKGVCLSDVWENRSSFLKGCIVHSDSSFLYSSKTQCACFSDIFMSPFPNWIRVVFSMPTIYWNIFDLWRKNNWKSITRYVNDLIKFWNAASQMPYCLSSS